MAVDSSLAQLIEYWLSNDSNMSTREFAILLLETIRDDISQATAKDGSHVTNICQVRKYLDDQVVALGSAQKQ